MLLYGHAAETGTTWQMNVIPATQRHIEGETVELQHENYFLGDRRSTQPSRKGAKGGKMAQQLTLFEL